MIFKETGLEGAYVIEIEKVKDHRGFNARALCEREFVARGLESRFVQGNVLYNQKKGTLRGFHYQRPPRSEIKLVRCIHGAIFDAIIDMRPDSATYQKWVGVELSRANRRALYIPREFAHGFVTLCDDTELFYLTSEFYSPEHEAGVRFDDPDFAVRWPVPVEVISEKDRSWPDYRSNTQVSEDNRVRSLK